MSCATSWMPPIPCLEQTFPGPKVHLTGGFGGGRGRRRPHAAPPSVAREHVGTGHLGESSESTAAADVAENIHWDLVVPLGFDQEIGHKSKDTLCGHVLERGSRRCILSILETKASDVHFFRRELFKFVQVVAKVCGMRIRTTWAETWESKANCGELQW